MGRYISCQTYVRLTSGEMCAPAYRKKTPRARGLLVCETHVGKLRHFTCDTLCIAAHAHFKSEHFSTTTSGLFTNIASKILRFLINSLGVHLHYNSARRGKSRFQDLQVKAPLKNLLAIIYMRRLRVAGGDSPARTTTTEWTFGDPLRDPH